MRDFTIGAYEALLIEIRKTGCPVFSLKEYFESADAPPAFFILRHDVDRRPRRALTMAGLEKSLDISSTYYFRLTPRVFNREIIGRIASMGHEIGYHYEVLDKSRGNHDGAAKIFLREISTLREVAEVKTASMHGNPLSRWDNRDFWKHVTPARFGLLGEAYGGIKDPGIVYVTDTGRGWNRHSFNLRDRFPPGAAGLPPSFSSTRELAEAIRERKYARMYLQVHPNRWSAGTLEWWGQWGEDLLLNGVKWCWRRVAAGRSEP